VPIQDICKGNDLLRYRPLAERRINSCNEPGLLSERDEFYFSFEPELYLLCFF
jgi:hypothetical protein